MKSFYLPGLNALRFFAAFFVVISHANISLDKLGIQQASSQAFLNRGGDAVEFFFTLSGFLITYLLIGEIKKTGTVSIRQFYLRRVYRIWPLYFLIVIVGFVLLGYVYPKINQKPFFTFSISHGLMLFILFLPNYAAKNYPTGLLNPLWSIGVEEQFYLFWAPLVKLCRRRLKSMIGVFVVASTAFYGLVYHRVFPIPPNWEAFFLSQKFYAMAIGSSFGYVLFHGIESYRKSFFSSKWMQLAVILSLLGYYSISGWWGVPESLAFRFFLPVLYGFLILNVSSIPNKVVNLEVPVLSYLGVISYGIYMYHMPVDYLLRSLVAKLSGLHLPNFVIIASYYILLLAGTVMIADLSYRYFESFFLRIKAKLHAPNA